MRTTVARHACWAIGQGLLAGQDTPGDAGLELSDEVLVYLDIKGIHLLLPATLAHDPVARTLFSKTFQFQASLFMTCPQKTGPPKKLV